MIGSIIISGAVAGVCIALLLESSSLRDSNDLGNSEGDISDFADGPLRVKEFKKRIRKSEYHAGLKKSKA